jgi:capsular polysaccharide biosynthesis protein
MVAVSERLLVEDNVDNRELVVVLWRRRWLIVICTICAIVLAAVLGFTMTPVYRGAAILVPVSSDRGGLDGGGLGSALGSVGGLAALAGLGLGSKESQVEETLAVLKSRQFTEAFISRYKLTPELFGKRWDAATGNWKIGAEVPTLHDAFRQFDSLRKIDRDTKTGLITLKVDFTDRAKAADWCNTLVERLNDEMRRRAIESSAASIGYLEKELASTTVVDTREAISRLMETQIRQRMLANVTQEYALRFVDRAMVADRTDKVAPRKALMMIAGMLIGGAIGCGLALLLNMRETALARRPS